MGLDFQIKTPPRAGFVAMNPDCGKHREQREGRGQLAGELRSDDQMFRGNNIDTVGREGPVKFTFSRETTPRRW